MVPVFDVETKLDLNEPLKALGMTDMFENKADFSGISDTNLHVEKVVTKTVVKVSYYIKSNTTNCQLDAKWSFLTKIK